MNSMHLVTLVKHLGTVQHLMYVRLCQLEDLCHGTSGSDFVLLGTIVAMDLSCCSNTGACFSCVGCKLHRT